jgi:hypothetical protein
MKKIDLAIMECYRRLYKHATPSADFDTLLENATIDEQGLKHIPYLDYELEDTEFERIISEVIKEYKIPKRERRGFEIGMYLGCSPKTKITE